jgi:arylformamidase
MKTMRVYDVTLTISPDLPTWPGDPKLGLERVEKIEDGGQSNVTWLSMSAHMGTHVDAPYHYLSDGMTIEKMAIKALIGRAYVLHLPDVDRITPEIIEEASIPPRTRRVLFRTRNSEFWARKELDFQRDYVAITAEGAEYLVDKGVKLVGIDYLSIAPFEHTRLTHEIFLNAGVIIVEGLDLSGVAQGRYTLYCLPLKLSGADAAPARAVLIGV